MNTKKILIISRAFYPTNSPRSLRATELVKEFARQGHEVTLLTIKDDAKHIPFEEEYGVTIKDLGPLRFPEVALNGSYGIWRLWKRVLRRMLLLLFEYPDIELMYRVQKALKKESGYDLLISIAVPHPIHWGVAWARTPKHRIADVWAADCGDPYVGLENDSFKAPFYFSYVEKWFCRKADFITIPFEGAKSAYFPEFHPKIRIIPQGLSFPPEKPHTDNSAKNESITFAYFGNIRSYLHYAVPFLEKLNAVEQPFKFVVYTRDKDLFKATLNGETLQKCILRDYVERDVLLDELRGVDFLIHFPYQKESQKSLKLVDYNFLKKPILEYRNDAFSDRVFKEFLVDNFENKKNFEDYTKFRIEKVSGQFLELEQENKQMTPSDVTVAKGLLNQ